MPWKTESKEIVFTKALGKRALTGAGIAVALLTILLLNSENMDYGAWVILPLITVSIAGASGAVFYSLMVHRWFSVGWKRMLAVVVSMVVYVVLVWLAMIAAFNFTGHWS